jgi:hypothetical protein
VPSRRLTGVVLAYGTSAEREVAAAAGASSVSCDQGRPNRLAHAYTAASAVSVSRCSSGPGSAELGLDWITGECLVQKPSTQAEFINAGRSSFAAAIRWQQNWASIAGCSPARLLSDNGPASADTAMSASTSTQTVVIDIRIICSG